MRSLLFAISMLLSSVWWGKATAQIQTDTTETNLLFEHFSNENYFNIDNIDYQLYQKLWGLGDNATLIQYQTYLGGYDPVWSENSNESNVRQLYYGVNYSNQLRINGLSGSNTISSLLDTTGMSSDIAQNPLFQLKISQFQITGNNLQVQGVVRALANLPSAEYTVYAAVIERDVITSSGSFYRQHIFRKMLPSVAGDSYVQSWVAGDSVEVSYNWTISNYVDASANLGVVFFVQDYNTKQIYQSLSTFQQVIPSQFNPKALIEGNIYLDNNGSCSFDVGEQPIGGWLVKLEGTNDVYYAWADAATGNFSFSVPGDNYQLECLTPDAYWQACPMVQVVSANSGDTINVNVAAQSLWSSPMLFVDVSTPLLRRCSTSVFHVRYCNQGSALAPNSYVELELDGLLSMGNSLLPFVALGNNKYRFDVGNLQAGKCDRFWFEATVSCSALSGQTHCTQAFLGCDTAALNLWSDPTWDGADLRVAVQCETDSVRFTLQNVGLATPQSEIGFFVAEDEIMLRTGNTQIAPGQSVQFALPANAATYYLRSGQSANHPYAPFTAAAVEGCGSGSFQPDMLLQYPIDDNRPFQDIHCQTNATQPIGSSIKGFPTGYSALHFIEKETAIEYLLRFQNTEDDTAHTIFVEDRLSPYLDIERIELGASSHPFRLEIVGERTLMFIIENAQIPSVFTNEAASHGFIQFRIFPKQNVSNGTIIENQFLTYFNYNPPSGTTPTTHQIGTGFVQTRFVSDSLTVTDYNVQIYPNPFGESTTIAIQQPDEMGTLQFRLFNSFGHELRNEQFDSKTFFQFYRHQLPRGVYLYRIENKNGKRIDSGKIMIE